MSHRRGGASPLSPRGRRALIIGYLIAFVVVALELGTYAWMGRAPN